MALLAFEEGLANSSSLKSKNRGAREKLAVAASV
jgi:hypothetical protein